MEYNVTLDVEEVKTAVKGLNKILLKPNFILSFLFFLFGLLIIGFYIWIEQTSLYIVCASVVFVTTALMLGFSFFAMAKSQRALKSSIEYKYNFNDDSIGINVKTDSNTAFINLKYNEIYKVRGNDKYLYIFINRAQAYLLKKENLDPNIIDLLRKNVRKFKEN